MIKTNPELLQGGEEVRGRSQDIIILCLFLSLREILAPRYSTVGRHLESILVRGSGVIINERERPHGGGRKWQCIIFAVAVQICFYPIEWGAPSCPFLFPRWTFQNVSWNTLLFSKHFWTRCQWFHSRCQWPGGDSGEGQKNDKRTGNAGDPVGVSSLHL